MPQSTVAVRVAALEETVKRFDAFLDAFEKTLEHRFRQQAEMLDERFARVDQNIAVVRGDIGALQTGMTNVRGDIGVLQTDMTYVREGIKLILERMS